MEKPCLYLTSKRKVSESSEFKLFITVDEENDISTYIISKLVLQKPLFLRPPELKLYNNNKKVLSIISNLIVCCTIRKEITEKITKSNFLSQFGLVGLDQTH